MTQNLIPLAQPADTTATVTSIELLKIVNEERAKAGESVVRHNVFLSRCKDELDGEPYKIFVESAKGQTPAFEAIEMTQDQCKLVAMRESKSVRRHVLARLKELEAKVAQPAFQIPATLSAALRLAAEQAEQIERQQEQLAIAAPKVEFVDRYVESTGNKCFRTVAKLLGAKEPALRAFLQYRGVMYLLDGEWMAYSQHHAAGRFVVKTGSRNGHSFAQTLFTPKGVQWIAGQWAKHQLPETETLF